MVIKGMAFQSESPKPLNAGSCNGREAGCGNFWTCPVHPSPQYSFSDCVRQDPGLQLWSDPINRNSDALMITRGDGYPLASMVHYRE